MCRSQKREEPGLASPQNQSPKELSAGLAATIDERLAAKERETVLQIAQGGRTRETALEIAQNAAVWADHVVVLFEADAPLPRPIVCRSGCEFCCFTQVEVTPPEALIIGDYIDKNFSDSQKFRVMAAVERWRRLTAGKSKPEIARIRHELPCPLLQEQLCSVYPARPLMCRAMHSLNIRQCRFALQSGDRGRVDHYAHRRDLVASITKGLMDGCQSLGCQCGSMDLVLALESYFRERAQPERWIRGEEVFRGLAPLPWDK